MFKPAWWLPGGHAQTLWGSLCRPLPRPALHRQRLELPDGDFLDLDWSRSAADASRPLVLILHGMEGSSRSSYVRGLVAQLEHEGLAAVVMHFRGCSGTPNRLERTYHSGETGDLALVSRWLRRHWPERPIAAAGFSLGGNVLLKHLGEHSQTVALDAAAVACVPMQLAVCAQRLDKGLSRIYGRRLLKLLKAKLAAKYRSGLGHWTGTPSSAAQASGSSTIVQPPCCMASPAPTTTTAKAARGSSWAGSAHPP